MTFYLICNDNIKPVLKVVRAVYSVFLFSGCKLLLSTVCGVIGILL